MASRVELAPAVPLRLSSLYAMQGRYYAEAGSAAWASGQVPDWITSNAFVAHVYASTILAAYRDLHDAGALCLGEPLVLLELGTGTGRLSHLLLSNLLQRLPSARLHGPCRCGCGRVLPPPRRRTGAPAKPSEGTAAASDTDSKDSGVGLRLQYIMSDFSAAAFPQWLTNPALQAHVEAGVLTYGIFDAQAVVHERASADVHSSGSGSVGVRLWQGGGWLGPQQVRNPLVAIANYLFDSLYMDAFRVLGGEVAEGRVSVGVSSDAPPHLLRDPTSPQILPLMDNRWQWEPIADPAAHYTPAELGAAAAPLNAALAWYGRHVLQCRLGSASPDPRVPSLAVYDPAPPGSTLAHKLASATAAAEAAEAAEAADAAEAAGVAAVEAAAVQGGTEAADGAAADGAAADEAGSESDAASTTSSSTSGSSHSSSSSSSASSASYEFLPPCDLSATVLLSVGASLCLEQLRALSGTKGFLLLVCDKGMVDPGIFVGGGPPDMHVHGSFSMMVNFHALRLWANTRGGEVCVTPDDDTNVKTAVLMHIPAPKPTKPNITATATATTTATAADADAAGGEGLKEFLTFEDDAPLLLDVFNQQLERFGIDQFYDLCNAFKPPPAGAAAAGVDTRVPSTGPTAGHAAAGRAGRGGRKEGRESPLFVDSDSDEDISAGVLHRDSNSNNEATEAITAVDAVVASTRHDRPTRRDDGGSDSAAAAAAAAADRAPAAASSSCAVLTLRAAVALCRLGGWDVDVFHRVRDVFAARLPALTPPRRQQIMAGVAVMASNFFPIPGSTVEFDVPFEIGRLHQLAGNPRAALPWYVRSMRALGPHAAKAFNTGVCCARLGQLAHARRWLQQAIALHEGPYHEALDMLQSVEEDLAVGDAQAEGATQDEDASQAAPTSSTSSSSSSNSSSTGRGSPQPRAGATMVAVAPGSDLPATRRVVLPGMSHLKLYV